MIRTKIILETRTTLKDGTYRVKLRITANKVQRYYPLNCTLSKNEFEQLSKSRPAGKLLDTKFELEGYETKAKNIIANLPVFTFDLFEERFTSKALTNNKNLTAYFQEIIDTKKSLGEISTAGSYLGTINSLKRFCPTISWSTINTVFLKKYEFEMTHTKMKSRSTVGIYMRNLRAVLNKAIDDGIITKDSYCFGKKKYIIPSSNNPKRSLTKDHIRQLVDSQNKLLEEWEDICKVVKEYDAGELEKDRINPVIKSSYTKYYKLRTLDFFLFSYYCQGMNMADILKLKGGDVQKDFIYFNRSKTIKSSNGVLIDVPLLEPAKNIMNRWMLNRGSKEFLFPYINNTMSAIEIYKVIHQFIQMTNKYLKIVSVELGFEFEITTYFARHTFSKSLADNNIPLAYISKSLGHSTITTTQKYLNSFDDYDKHEIARRSLLVY